mgnify:CR=1 FL=1
MVPSLSHVKIVTDRRVWYSIVYYKYRNIYLYRMSYLLGTMMGLVSVFSFIRTNDKLQEKYYCIMADAKDKWKINAGDISSLKYKDWKFCRWNSLEL